jgi:hypothetical protein
MNRFIEKERKEKRYGRRFRREDGTREAPQDREGNSRYERDTTNANAATLEIIRTLIRDRFAESMRLGVCDKRCETCLDNEIRAARERLVSAFENLQPEHRRSFDEADVRACTKIGNFHGHGFDLATRDM